MQARLMKPISCFVLCAFVLLDLSVSSAGARLIDTQSVLAAQQQESTRQQVAALFDREEVQQLLAQQGIDAVEAQNRVASLSDEELAKVARAMDQLPAGGNGVGAVIGAVVFIFVLLLVTDILGLTHVYPFVSHTR